MKNTKWNIMIYLHAALLIWALLFLGSLIIPDGGKTASVFAVGNFLLLFVNIPFAALTLVLQAKNYFSTPYKVPAVVLSILNIVVGVISWLWVILLLQMP